MGYEKNGVRTILGTKTNKGYGEVVPVDLLVNLKEDGSKAAFTFINGPCVGYVDMGGRDRRCCHKWRSVLVLSKLVNKWRSHDKTKFWMGVVYVTAEDAYPYAACLTQGSDLREIVARADGQTAYFFVNASSSLDQSLSTRYNLCSSIYNWNI